MYLYLEKLKELKTRRRETVKMKNAIEALHKPLKFKITYYILHTYYIATYVVVKIKSCLLLTAVNPTMSGCVEKLTENTDMLL